MRNQPPGKFTDHFAGLGTITWDMVTARAREIAIINGRSPEQVLHSDIEEARSELQGVHTHSRADDVPEAQRWEPIPAGPAHQVDKMEADDEQTVADELVQEGSDEAEHERMLQATKAAEKKDRS